MSGKDKYGYQHEDGHYSKMTGNDTNSSFSIYDKNPSEPDHSAIHININTDILEKVLLLNTMLLENQLKLIFLVI